MLKSSHFIAAFLAVSSLAANTGSPKQTRYIFFDVNPGEGFNLRRDVFMRIATFVKKLNEEVAREKRYVLVLPPWGRIYHWQSQELMGRQSRLPWRSFFDIASIDRYVPVIELDQYLESHDPFIDVALYLQNYKEGWSSGAWEEKWDFRKCNEAPRYQKSSQLYRGWFWGYGDLMAARKFFCVSIQGSASLLKELVNGEFSDADTVMLDRAETVLHDLFGDEEYWSSRRSMRFSKELQGIANQFRREQLQSDDEKEGTVMSDNWKEHVATRGQAKGGDYLCVHLRRRDYTQSRKDQIPSVKGAALQVAKKLEELGLHMVFVATDAPVEEFEEFRAYLLVKNMEVKKFMPDREMLERLKDGGVAIVDQIICSHARYLMGSPESTFTFRIQEEREIMGFDERLTFNMLCPEGQFHCKKPSIWRIQYPTTTEERVSRTSDEL